ncbi:MAG: XRE family transcriptional regulator [Candidatus Eisenbacteria bacterium]
MALIIDVEELGRRIRKLRLDRRMTLKQVEDSCGLSATHLSEIERGRTSPTIGALVRIARALERDASFFIESEEREEVASYLREQQNHASTHDGLSVEKLSAGIPGSGMFPYRVKLGSGSQAALRFSAQDLPGDVIYMLQNGSVTASVGEAEFLLTAGDSMQASLTQAHFVRPTGEQTAELLLFSTRPIAEEG